MNKGGQFLLGGHMLNEGNAFRSMFTRFWSRLKIIRPDLDLFTHDNWDLSCCIPVAFHGDEGRGKLKRPVMVLGYQPVISVKGDGCTNASGFLVQLNYVFWESW